MKLKWTRRSGGSLSNWLLVDKNNGQVVGAAHQTDIGTFQACTIYESGTQYLGDFIDSISARKHVENSLFDYPKT